MHRVFEPDQVLAIEPECFRRWQAEVRAHAWDPALLEQLRSNEAALKLAPARKAVGDIAVINVAGFISQKPSLFTVLFGVRVQRSWPRRCRLRCRSPRSGPSS